MERLTYEKILIKRYPNDLELNFIINEIIFIMSTLYKYETKVSIYSAYITERGQL